MSYIITPLVPIEIPSTYNHAPLPKRMAVCTPDTREAILAVAADLRGMGHELRLSDLYRSYEMQKQANLDYVEHRKTAFSPPPGSSMHEAGRAMDIDLSAIGVPLARFWEIAAGHGFQPIISRPVSGTSESWHFDHPGSHKAVYDYIKSGKCGSVLKPYSQMARSGILSIGIQMDHLPDRNTAWIQSALIRLGFDPGPIDGVSGARTRDCLKHAGCDPANPLEALATLLKSKFPQEF